MKYILSESKLERMLSMFDSFANSENYEGVDNIMVDYDDVMDKFVLNIFFNKKFAVDVGPKLTSIHNKIVNQVGHRFELGTGMKPLIYTHFTN